MKCVIDKEKVHQAMKSCNISTQQELADIMGITKNQLSVILSTKSSSFKSTYDKMCTSLQVSMLELLSEKDEKIYKKEVAAPKKERVINTTTVVPKRQYNSIELFAGAGGLALGLEKAGFCAKGLIEIDKHASETLRKNRPSWNVIEEDIVKVAEQGIKNYLEEAIDIDFISGGYPCQSFSYAGHKLGLEDVRGTMFYYFAQIVEQLKPKVFLAENVRGLLSHDDGKTLETMIQIYEAIGYKVSKHLIKALDYNVAQKRERVIIVGIREDYEIEYRLPQKCTNQLVLRDVLKNVPNSIGEKYSEKKKMYWN